MKTCKQCGQPYTAHTGHDITGRLYGYELPPHREGGTECKRLKLTGAKPQGASMIQPTIGRIVLYRPAVPNMTGILPDENGQCPGIITKVWHERMVNLTVFDAAGVSHPVTSVPLFQPEDERNQSHGYCEWMPYQVKKPTGSESGEQAAGQQAI